MEQKLLEVELPRNNSLGEIGVARSLSARVLGSSTDQHHSPPLRFSSFTEPRTEMQILLQESQQCQSLPEEMLFRTASLQDSEHGAPCQPEKTIYV